ncbi:MAG TPA: alpha/beta hydrolase [Jiangellales bacterium]|nr:alpha/beta hydrolase [Jiangellales bacterium]
MIRGACAAALAGAMLLSACTSSEPEADPTPTPTASAEPEPTTQNDPLAPFYTQQLAWEPCEDGDEFECATLTVPLDYDAPDAGTVELAVLRSPSSSDDRIGSLLVNPGGPGGSGIEFARSQDVVSGDVRDRYDIVGFDPRGVGESTPIDCLTDEELDELVALDGAPSDDAELAELREEYRDLAAGCEADAGELLPHLGTANVARDMDVLRAVLGDESLHYLGKSYGTYIGALYADQFPERVGRMVLDGAVDPSLTGPEFALGQAGGVETALSGYLAWCVERDDCPLGASETEARDTLIEFLEVVDAEPLPTSDEDRPLTKSLATLGIILPLYVTPEQGYPILTDALRDAMSSDGDVLMDLADIYLDRNDDGTYNGNQNEVLYAVHCVDRPDVTDPEEVEATLPEFEEASPVFGPFLAWGGLACGEWPVQAEAEPTPVTAPGAAPILVVGTTGDLATPYEWAISLADQLESGFLLTYDGFGHLAYRTAGSDCVDSVVDTYLLEGELPDEEPTCD